MVFVAVTSVLQTRGWFAEDDTLRWSFSLGVFGFLLGACAQMPVAPAEPPVASATMSTGKDDAATQVVVDAESNAYVLGTASSRGFLNRYRADGTLL